MLDHMLDGRFIFGISPGGLLSDAEAFGNLDADRNAMFLEAINQVLAIWAGEPPYNLKGKYWTSSTERTLMPDIGQGFLPKPLQQPHPPIVVTAVAPFSKGVTEAAARGWEPISANFLMPEWVKSHWPKYVEGCERAGRPADPANWRVAKSIFVADDDKTAKAYATAPNSPYRYYYSQLFTKLKKNGRARAVQDAAATCPTSEVTLDMRLRQAHHPRLARQGRRPAPRLPRRGRRFRHAALRRQGLARPALAALHELLAEKVMPEVNAATNAEGEDVTMAGPRVFVTQPIAESALARLRAVADVEVNPDSSKVLTKAKLIEGVKRCDILLSLLHDTVDADVLAANPNLMAVSSMNITQDRIDLAAATSSASR